MSFLQLFPFHQQKQASTKRGDHHTTDQPTTTTSNDEEDGAEDLAVQNEATIGLPNGGIALCIERELGETWAAMLLSVPNCAHANTARASTALAATIAT